jgi:hypothetical protein
MNSLMLRATFIATLGFACLLAGCTASLSSRGMLERNPEAAALSSRQLGLLLTDYAKTFADAVKHSADLIQERTSDLSSRRAALVWKIRAVPAVYTVAAHEDPLFGLSDLWILSIQQREYFSREEMPRLFGEEQYIAVAVARQLEANIRTIARQTLTTDETFADLEKFVEEFAAQHPMEDISLARDSIGPLYIKFMEDRTDLSQALGAVGDYAETALTLALIGLNHVPEMARWQAELTLLDAETYPVIGRAVESMDALGVVAVDLKGVAEDLPVVIDEQRDAILGDIERQRAETLRDIELMRRAVFVDLGLEREAVLAGLEEQIQLVLAALGSEREALTAQIPTVAERAGQSVLPLTREVIDYAFWRGVQLSVLLAVLLLATILILRMTRKRGRQ